MERLGEDEHGVWLWAPVGTELRRGPETPSAAQRAFVKVIPDGPWWTGIWNDGPGNDGRSIRTYVDVITPAVWDGDTVRMVDLDLDVVQRRDGTVEVEDEDEFEDHRVAFGYPEHVVDRARSEAAQLVLAIERGNEPFGETGNRWLEESLGR
jgi:predicted RNA-binding protein associated with RNAse of E/G family